jgi:antitoxin VapB
VRRALEDRLDRLRRAQAGRTLADELDAIGRRFTSLEVRDRRTADEILGHDDDGLPT